MSTERIISADSHVNPPKDLWTRNPPAALKDRVPRVESTDMLAAGGERLSCTLATAPGSDRGTYVCN